MKQPPAAAAESAVRRGVDAADDEDEEEERQDQSGKGELWRTVASSTLEEAFETVQVRDCWVLRSLDDV
jgi:hypothetical protein